MASQSQPAVRERVAFVHRGEASGLDPDAITVKDGHFTVPKFEAVREDRITIQLNGLPVEVVTHIKAFSTLSLRWTSPWAYGTLDPFASRSPPGLHMTYELLDGAQNAADHACYFLKACGVSSCDAEVFQSSLAKPGKKKPSSVFFQTLEDLGALSRSLKDLCSYDDVACITRAADLPTASGFEFVYEAGGPVKMFVFWPLKEHTVSLSSHPSRRTEVGIFSGGSPFDTPPHALGLMGDLVTLEDQGKRSPVSFQLHSRHRSSDDHFSSAFLSPTGLHPSLQLRLHSNKPPQVDGDCALYTYLSLPKAIFPDQYQLDDELFMASKNLTSLVQQWGSVDLEAPAYRSKTWGSYILVELATPSHDDVHEWTAEIPLHLRYLEPAEAGKSEVEIPYPAVFWACEAGDDVDFHNNPFDRAHVGYDSQFSPSTSFWHLSPRPETGNRLTNPITVPVLKAAGAEWVEAGTSAVIAAGFGWVLWKLASSFSIFGYNKKGSGTRTSPRQVAFRGVKEEEGAD